MQVISKPEKSLFFPLWCAALYIKDVCSEKLITRDQHIRNTFASSFEINNKRPTHQKYICKFFFKNIFYVSTFFNLTGAPFGTKTLASLGPAYQILPLEYCKLFYRLSAVHHFANYLGTEIDWVLKYLGT
jgi:hypothetical protein